MTEAVSPRTTRCLLAAALVVAAATLAPPTTVAHGAIAPSALADFARRTHQRLENLVGPAEWRPPASRLDSAARTALRARLTAEAAASSGDPPIRFAEPPLDTPAPPGTPLFPDSLTAELSSVARGDIDGDGIPDLVGVEYDDSMLVVRRGLAGGGFAATQRFPLATGAFVLTLGDFDGDGRLDVATANTPPGGPTYSVLRNEGGTFGPRVDGALVAGVPFELLAADLGHDGRLDLVVHTYSNTRMDVLIGRGDGTFEPVRSLVPGSANNYDHETAISVGDLDGDAIPDLAVLYADGDCYYWDCEQLAVFYGRADATFESPEVYQAFDPDTPVAATGIAFGDRDGDGSVDLTLDVDIETGSGIPSAALARGIPGRRVEAPALRGIGRTPWQLAALRRAPGAVPDLVVSDLLTTSLVPNTGRGTFGPDQLIARGALLAATDVDGDGLTDLVLGRSDSIDVWRGDGAGGFAAPGPPAIGTFVGVADVTGDHRPDIVVALPSGALGVAAGDGVGGFGAPVDWGTSLGAPTGYWGVLPTALADFDGDGRADVATMHPSADETLNDTLLVAWSRGTSFSAPDTFDAGPNSLYAHDPTASIAMATPDLDGDGRPDLALLKGQGESGSGGFVTSLRNLGHRGFSSPQDLLGASEDPLQLAVADFDGDGKTDVAIADAMTDFTGRFVLFRGTAAGTLEPVNGPSVMGGYALHHYGLSIAVGDFTGDGRTDVAVGCGVASYGGAVIATVPNTTPASLPTPTLASLEDEEISSDVVALTWYVQGSGVVRATLERRTSATEWITLGVGAPDGTGRVRFEDRSVSAGSRYAYRLSLLRSSGATTFTTETWIDVPARTSLAIVGASPNPTTGPLAVRFTLPNASRARLELLDVAGRRVRERVIESAGGGEQRVSFSDRDGLAPGLYFLRLTQNREAVQSRIAVVR